MDTVDVSGTGRWNGQTGYRFQFRATGAAEPGRGRDTFALIIRDPQGVVVASVSALLRAGNIQWRKMPGTK